MVNVVNEPTRFLAPQTRTKTKTKTKVDRSSFGCLEACGPGEPTQKLFVWWRFGGFQVTKELSVEPNKNTRAILTQNRQR